MTAQLLSSWALLFTLICSSLLGMETCNAFAQVSRSTARTRASPSHCVILSARLRDHDGTSPSSLLVDEELLERRHLLQRLPVAATTAALAFSSTATEAANAAAEDPETMFAPKFVQEYEDFIKTPEGWSYRDVKVGSDSSNKAKMNDRVVFDWSGYTIGYFGRPFQAKGGPQGGAFDKDIDYQRTVLGSGQVVKGLECAMVGMSAGGVRQVVVPFDQKQALSYPLDDLNHDRVGPKPTTFSGQRALNFVLENPRIDRTLLFNVKVIRVDKPDGKGGFVRG